MQTDAYITGGPFLTGPSTSCFVLAARINIDSVKSERDFNGTSVARVRLFGLMNQTYTDSNT